MLWIAPAILHGHYNRFFFVHKVENGVWKPRGRERTMITPVTCMASCRLFQMPNDEIQMIDEHGTAAGFLTIVKLGSLDEIPSRFLREAHGHCLYPNSFLMLANASANGRDLDRPLS